MRSSEYDRFAELKKIQQQEYKRVVTKIAEDVGEPARRNYPIFTDRTAMERKDDKRKHNIIWVLF